eukprot:TRINITY_DN6154_c1_g2_i1.p1 TRINITY_DN6154_c1_g2~~TRINITY_DN6154_c1_g2_i1.p1  ORF type:complete len:161 (+),score=46.74 TRINITY_DN6154_c1_g2_i1:323-805(+)
MRIPPNIYTTEEGLGEADLRLGEKGTKLVDKKLVKEEKQLEVVPCTSEKGMQTEEGKENGRDVAEELKAVREERERLEEVLHSLQALYTTTAGDAAFTAVCLAARCAVACVAHSLASQPLMPITITGTHAAFIADLDRQRQEADSRRRLRHEQLKQVLQM